jgi:hypothetical protein
MSFPEYKRKKKLSHGKHAMSSDTLYLTGSR